MFRRLGLTGAILIASFFVFGVLAGAVVVHRLEVAPAADVQGQGEQKEKAEKAEKAEKPEKPEPGEKAESENKSADDD